MKQWDMQHIGVFDINFDTGERYWSAELRRILRVPDGVPAELLVYCNVSIRMIGEWWPLSRQSLCKASAGNTARSIIGCSTPMVRCGGCTSNQPQFFVPAAEAMLSGSSG